VGLDRKQLVPRTRGGASHASAGCSVYGQPHVAGTFVFTATADDRVEHADPRSLLQM